MLNPYTPDKLIRVMLVDDDEEDYLLTRDLMADLPHLPYELDWVADYEAGLAAVVANSHDVYLLDYRLGARDGLELLIEGRQANPTAPMILLTGCGEWEIDRKAVQAGAADYLEKSRLDPTILERSIRHALLQKRYEADLSRKVRERTAALEELNQSLHKEIQERQRAEEALKDADRRKDEFLATLAHELRNPLAPVRNALEIMRLAADRPDAVEQARAVMERQVTQMVRLIDDLLDVSRITRGKLKIVREVVPIQDIAESALEISRSQIEKAGLTLELDIIDAPLRVRADRMRMAQVLSNLLNNAAKYTESGGTVTLAIGKDGSHAVVRVRDTGLGIAADVLPQIFDLFTQFDRTAERSQGGLGIGLALVEQLLHLHDGTVTAHSDGLNQGSEFVVRLALVESA